MYRSFQILGLSLVLATSALEASASTQNIPDRWKAGFAKIYRDADGNLQNPGKRNPYYHTHPAKRFMGVYMWDSAFIALVWKDRNPYIAKQIIKSVLHNQQKDGRVPHVVSIMGTSEWTNPPVLAMAAAQIARESMDLAFAREIFPKLKRANEWVHTHRRSTTGLFFWDHHYESGLDISPRFGARDESYHVDTRELDAVDFSSLMVVDCEALADLAGLIGLPEEQAFFTARAEAIKMLIRQLLWDEETGYFYDRNLKTGKLLKIATIASLYPLTAGAASPEQALRLMNHIRNPKEFNTPIPFPTVARNSPWFEKDMWRGPVWINTAYLVIRGMKRYGHVDEAREMSSRLVDGVYSTWHYTGKVVEFYDPEAYGFRNLSRKKGLGWLGLSKAKSISKILKHLVLKQIILGKKPVDHYGWTGLVNTLVLENGLTPPPNAPPLPPPRR